MKSEAEIRKTVELLRRAIAMSDRGLSHMDRAMTVEERHAYKLIHVEERLLSWVLGECGEVDAIYQDLDKELRAIPSEN